MAVDREYSVRGFVSPWHYADERSPIGRISLYVHDEESDTQHRIVIVPTNENAASLARELRAIAAAILPAHTEEETGQ